MNREKRIKQLSSYLEGDLGPSELHALERALREDESLRKELEALREMRNLLRSLPDPEVPSGLSARVMARVRAGETQDTGFSRKLALLFSFLNRKTMPPLVTVACGVVAAFLFFGTDNGSVIDENVDKSGSSENANHRDPEMNKWVQSGRRLFVTVPKSNTESGVVGEHPFFEASVSPEGAQDLATCMPGTRRSDPACNRSYMRWLRMAREDEAGFWHQLSKLPNPQRKIWHGRLVDFAARSGSEPLVFRPPSIPDDAGIVGSFVVAE